MQYEDIRSILSDAYREQQAIITANLDVRTLAAALQQCHKLTSFCLVFEETVDALLEDFGILFDVAFLDTKASRYRHLYAVFQAMRCAKPCMARVKAFTVAAGSDGGIWSDPVVLEVAQQTFEDITDLHVASHCPSHWCTFSYPVLRTLRLSTLCLTVDALEQIICDQAPSLRTLYLDRVVLSEGGGTVGQSRPYDKRPLVLILQALERIAQKARLEGVKILKPQTRLHSMIKD